MKIHIGCGKRSWPGWVNVDGGSFPHVVNHDPYLRDFYDSSADIIYCSHMLEYLDRQEGAEILVHWKRVLKPGGILRLAVPDFDSIVMAVTLHNFKLKDVLGPLYGKMKMGDQTIYHRTAYNYPDLKAILTHAGLSNVRRYDWRETDHAAYDDHSKSYLPHDPKAIETGVFNNHMSISLNVEATK